MKFNNKKKTVSEVGERENEEDEAQEQKNKNHRLTCLRSAEKRNRKRERERDDADGMVVMTGIKPIINHQHERTKKSDWSRWKIDAGDKSRFPFESDSINRTLSRGGGGGGRAKGCRYKQIEYPVYM